MILTVPKNVPLRVNVSSISMALSESFRFRSVTGSSGSYSWCVHGGEPEERKMPDAAACVSVGELREAEGLLCPRELRAIRRYDGLVVMGERLVAEWHPW